MTKTREQLTDILEELKLNKLKFEELRGLV
jgi:hypothetical protein